VTETPQQTQKPKLEQCLDRLQQSCRQLREVSGAYQQMKALLQQAQTDPSQIDMSQFNVVMTVPGTNYQVPLNMQGSQEQIVAAIENGAAALGEQIVSMWQEAHGITGEANQHCQAAAQAAEQQAEGTQ
jgi:exonuclease VII small subunit